MNSEFDEGVAYGVKIAVNMMLSGGLTRDGVELWWAAPHSKLDDKSPSEMVRIDPQRVVAVALVHTEGMIAT